MKYEIRISRCVPHNAANPNMPDHLAREEMVHSSMEHPNLEAAVEYAQRWGEDKAMTHYSVQAMDADEFSGGPIWANETLADKASEAVEALQAFYAELEEAQRQARVAREAS